MRWDRRSSGFIEVWYATVNHAETGSGLWLRYTLTAPDDGPAYCDLWAVCFDPDGKRTVVIKNRRSVDQLAPGHGPDDGAIGARIGDSWLSESHLEGSVEEGDHSIRWSLDIEPADRCFQHFPARLRQTCGTEKSRALCSPNLSVPFTGEVQVDGETLTFTGEHGCQSHRWGKRQALSWAWAHCSNFEQGERVVFEAAAGRATLGPIPIPTLTFVYLRFRDEDIAFNDLKWAVRAKGSYEMPTWAFSVRNERWKLVGAARSPIDRLCKSATRTPTRPLISVPIPRSPTSPSSSTVSKTDAGCTSPRCRRSRELTSSWAARIVCRDAGESLEILVPDRALPFRFRAALAPLLLDASAPSPL